MERRYYDERPSAVVVDVLRGVRYVTVNYGCEEMADGGFDLYSLTLVDDVAHDAFLTYLGDTAADMSAEEYKAVSAVMGYGSVDEVKAFVRRKIELHDKSESVNGFYVDGALMWLDKATRVGLGNSVAIEEAAGREVTRLWFGGAEFVIPIVQAKQMLAAVELYALDCYNVTASHLAGVSALSDAADVLGYDYALGYPERLEFQLL